MGKYCLKQLYFMLVLYIDSFKLNSMRKCANVQMSYPVLPCPNYMLKFAMFKDFELSQILFTY